MEIGVKGLPNCPHIDKINDISAVTSTRQNGDDDISSKSLRLYSAKNSHIVEI